MISKLREVFTTEYRQETEYRENAIRMLCGFLLKNEGVNIDNKVERLSENNFVSNFKLRVGELKPR